MLPKDWTLLAIAAAEGRALKPVQLQKTLFIVGRELRDVVGPGFYQFRAYDYGPFSHEVYRDAELLELEQLVAIERPNRWNQYRATPDGIARAQDLSSGVPQHARDYLQQVVSWAMDLSFQQLVRAVYARYPEMKANSKFHD